MGLLFTVYSDIYRQGFIVALGFNIGFAQISL